MVRSIGGRVERNCDVFNKKKGGESGKERREREVEREKERERERERERKCK